MNHKLLQMVANMPRQYSNDGTLDRTLAFPCSRIDHRRSREPVQLTLPFDDCSDLCMLPMDTIDAFQFFECLETVKPRVVSDVRHFRRFDLTGCAAREIRYAINTCGATYFHKAVPVGVFGADRLRSNLRFLCEHITEEVQHNVGSLLGPILFLVHTDQHSRILGPCLASSAETKSGHPWRLVNPPHEVSWRSYRHEPR